MCQRFITRRFSEVEILSACVPLIPKEMLYFCLRQLDSRCQTFWIYRQSTRRVCFHQKEGVARKRPSHALQRHKCSILELKPQSDVFSVHKNKKYKVFSCKNLPVLPSERICVCAGTKQKFICCKVMAVNLIRNQFDGVNLLPAEWCD